MMKKELGFFQKCLDFWGGIKRNFNLVLTKGDIIEQYIPKYCNNIITNDILFFKKEFDKKYGCK